MVFDQKFTKDSAITIAIKNNPCKICRSIGYPTCTGHGGKGGGGGGGSESKNNAAYASNPAATSSQTYITAIQEFNKAKAIFMQSQLLSNTTINYEAGLFSIESDRLRGNLTLKIKPGLSKAEEEIAREFLNAVKTEFNEFKNQLTEQGVLTEAFTAVIKDNELAIHIPNQKYYDAFIKHLGNKNLLPIPNPEQQVEKEITSKTKQEKNRPSPFGDILKGPPKGGIEV